jgi:hypothetical protein
VTADPALGAGASGRHDARRHAWAAMLGAAGSLLLFWPGVAMYDTVAQYGQVLGGAYDDWHPPAMARLWSLLAPLGPGATPMLALQFALWWLGFGLLAASCSNAASYSRTTTLCSRTATLCSRTATLCSRTTTSCSREGGSPGPHTPPSTGSTRHNNTGWLLLALGAWPPFLGWMAVVLKDAQMAGALIAATGVVGWWRLRGRTIPPTAIAGAALLIAYATLIRANAVFATAPLAAMLVPGKSAGWRTAAALLGIAGTLALAPVVNHHLLDAAPSGVERTEAIYDLAGIATRVPPGSPAAGLSAAEAREVSARGCSRAYFWDPLGEPSRCNATVERLRNIPVATLYATLATAALRHPFAYAAHRLAHLNSTERWLVPLHWPGAAPPLRSEPNEVGLGHPGAAARGWQRIAGLLVETPFGWPVVWVVLAAAGLASAARASLAPALFASALGQEASFTMLSIASDWRYHLWPIVATALGWALLGRPSPRAARIGGTALLLVVVAGLAARAVLPVPPQTYAGMLG